MTAPLRPTAFLRLLFHELKRRGVLRAASVYLVAAWVAIQASDVILPAFGLSDRSVAVVVLLAVAGFPVLVALTWLFRMGVDREDEPPEVARSRWRLHGAMALASVLGVGILGSSAWIALRPGAEPAASAAVPDPDLERVAVLYFTELGDDGAPAYLGTALTGALIDHLGGVEGLTVISRDGVAPYRDRPVSPDSLARALNVGTLVNGTVLRVREKVRVNVELTDARTGELLTSIRVDRPAEAPIELMDAVVGQVADSVLSQLGREQRLRRWQAGTASTQAWTLLQRAQELMDRSRRLHQAGENEAALDELAIADSLLVRAERIDPAYTAATVQRARVAERCARSLIMHGSADGVARALLRGERLASRVLEQQADAAAFEVRGVLRELRHVFAPPADPAAADALLAAAESDLRAAIRLEARRAEALQVLSSVLDARGAFTEALLYLEEAYRVDAYQQNAAQTVDRLFTINFELGRDEPAERWCAELRRRKGEGFQTATCELQLAAWSPLRVGSVVEARRIAAAAAKAQPAMLAVYGPLLDVLVAGVYARAGLTDSAHVLLARVAAQHNPHPELLQLEAGVRVLLGEYERASDLLRRYGLEDRGALLAGSRRFAKLPANPLRLGE